MNEPRGYPPFLLTRDDVAYMLSITERDVTALANSGHLTRVQDNKRAIKFRIEDVKAYADSLPERT